MNAAGIIFSNLHDNKVSELTRQRTMASIPFACRYRLIDFALSNMVNAEITNINVIAHYNYHSLMDHLGTGKDWDLARRTGGIKILPPYITAYANSTNNLYNTRLEALCSVIHSIRHIKEDQVVLSDCDVICNIDVKKLLDYHISYDSDITMVVKRVPHTEVNPESDVLIESDSENRITDIYSPNNMPSGQLDACMHIWVIKRDVLIMAVNDAIAHGYSSFNFDIIARHVKNWKMKVYRYSGFSAKITSFSNYFATSMSLLSDNEIRKNLFEVQNRPIFTKVRNSAPTKYVHGSSVSNSLIADGCIIEGTVDNSILFRGVKVGHGAVVKNSILFQDTIVSDNAFLNCVVTDKNAVIRDGRILSGHETLPFYIDKGRMI